MLPLEGMEEIGDCVTNIKLSISSSIFFNTFLEASIASVRVFSSSPAL